MFADSQLHPSLAVSLFRATWWWIPRQLLYMVRYVPTREHSRFRKVWQAIDKVANGLVDDAVDQSKSVEIEKGKRDVMSVLGESTYTPVVNSADDIEVYFSPCELVREPFYAAVEARNGIGNGRSHHSGA